MFGSDFLTITKSDEVDWDHLKPALLAAIMDHFTSGAPLWAEGAAAADASAEDVDYDDETKGS